MAKLRVLMIGATVLVTLAFILPAFMTVSAQPEVGVSSGNPVVLAATAQVTPKATDQASFARTVRSIWQAEPQLDQQTGECSGSPVNYCSQLVALTPRGRNMYWKGQELKPYLLIRIKPNIFVYSGRNSLGDGRVKVTLELTSPTTFKATQVLKLTKEPTCTHTMLFTGSFLR